MFFAVTIVLLVFVGLGLLGTLREVSILQGRVSALQNLLLRPPGPRFFDGMLPERAVATLRAAPLADNVRDFFVVFVRQACPGCANLLQAIKDAVAVNRLDSERFLCVVCGVPGGLDTRLRDSGFRVINDQPRALAEACQVKQTPTVLHLDSTLSVLDATVGDDIEWIYSRSEDPAIPAGDRVAS